MFRYRERMGISYQQLMDEPAEEIERAFTIWGLDAERDKLEAGRQQQKTPPYGRQ